MPARIVNSLSTVDRDAWNSLDLDGSPFLRHEFLASLEAAGCADASTGWQGCHLLLEEDGLLLGAVPLYLKNHSWGEFVFDFSWANAYTRAGIDYYPKLVSAVPFTPAPGPRILLSPEREPARTRGVLLDELDRTARTLGVSTLHVLFVEPSDLEAFANSGYLLRKDCQFHWHNRGFASFEEFLGTFRADKRKKVRRERRRVHEQGIRFVTLDGSSIDAERWRDIHALTAGTFHRHGHESYLNREFFASVARSQPETVMVKLAMHCDLAVAAAVFFVGKNTLYGRYWGARAEFHSLHFETCYYQGIEFCIERGLASFEPGTQGEHKIARGFEPSATFSAHWIADRRFNRAIGQYLAEETRAVEAYMDDVRQHLPYHRGVDVGS
jgi:predicted N-acyltransferase